MQECTKSEPAVHTFSEHARAGNSTLFILCRKQYIVAIRLLSDVQLNPYIKSVYYSIAVGVIGHLRLQRGS